MEITLRCSRFSVWRLVLLSGGKQVHKCACQNPKALMAKKKLFEYKKIELFFFFFFATVPQCQGLFFCVSRQTSLFICQQWQDNDYCLVCCGAICIVSDNRLTGEQRTKKQKGPKSQHNDTDFSNRSITGCLHLKHWGTGGFSLPRLFRKSGRFNFLSRLAFCFFVFSILIKVLITTWFGLFPWHDINMQTAVDFQHRILAQPLNVVNL